MRILKEDSIAVLVDVQEKLLPHIHEGEEILKRTARLIEGLRLLEVPVIVTQQYTKGLGPTHPLLAQGMHEFSYIEKISFSCCGEASFIDRLRESGKKTVILFGIETHVCVLQTCLDLLHSGYKPVLVYDCVSSRRPEEKRIAAERMKQEGAVVTTFESILFELARVAGTEVFKKISGLVK
ncbi:MAG: hydrolase [Bacteroidales bacterium]|jgi:nicotinamidase-related amidase|nr:hydrolase [Bacteroidales bacterium]MCU0408722.1 hydrolase [Bacteroidales bacterium]